MPGESFETVKETSDFAKRITEYLPEAPQINIKTLVALPGTPVYEYARYRGLLGKTLQDEEKYLLRVSDKSGGAAEQLNVTDYPYFIVQSWVRCVVWAVKYNFYKKNNYRFTPTLKLIWAILQIALRRRRKDKAFTENFYRNELVYRLRYLIAPLAVIQFNLKSNKRLFFRRCWELIVFPLRRKTAKYVSLREFLRENCEWVRNIKSESIDALRLGM